MPAPTLSSPPSFGLRKIATPLAVIVMLQACSNGPNGMDQATLTKEQAIIRQQSSNWQQTAATGLIAGGALGGSIGAAFGGEYALIGAGIGALLGLVAGVVVADRNLAFENRELNAKKRMRAAQELLDNLNTMASASERVSKRNRLILAELEQNYQAGRLTAAQYSAKAELMRADGTIMRQAAGETAEVRQRLVQTGREFPDLLRGEGSISSIQERLEGAAASLEEALARIPAS